LFEVFAIAATTNATSTLPAATTAAITGLTTGGLIPFGGSALVGYIIGFAIKKMTKWLLIGLGVLTGLIFLAVQWMANNGYIQGVKWHKFGNNIAEYGQHLATQIDFNNLQHSVFGTLGIPISSGLGIGLLAGFVRTR